MRRMLIALAMLLVPASLPAQEPKPPDGVTVVATEQLKGMLDRGEKLTLINPLSPLEFTQSKITGSVNLPYGQLRDGEIHLPEGRDATLVFYCLGPK